MSPPTELNSFSTASIESAWSPSTESQLSRKPFGASSWAMVGQVLRVLTDQNVSPPQDRVNLVFMGMGEPFLNYDNFIKAVRLLVEEVGIVESRMTVSTAGIVPRIHDFGLEAIRPKLAI